MARTIFIELLLFLSPFAVYAAILYLTQRDPRQREHWQARMLASLAIVGALLVIGGLVVFAHFGGSPPTGTYTPAQFKDGKLVPGQIK